MPPPSSEPTYDYPPSPSLPYSPTSPGVQFATAPPHSPRHWTQFSADRSPSSATEAYLLHSPSYDDHDPSTNEDDPIMDPPYSPYTPGAKESEGFAFAGAPSPRLREDLGGFALSRRARSAGPGMKFVPIPFTTWFAVCLVGLMVVMAVGVEILHAVAQHEGGLSNSVVSGGNWEDTHFLYTAVIVAVSIPVVGLWSYLTYWVKASQPWMDLASGSATAQSSLLLDYTADNNWLCLIPAVRNRHWLTFLSVVLSLLTLLISPFASSLFAVREVSTHGTFAPAQAQVTLGLTSAYASLEPFMSASGFVLAKVVYALDWPPFVDRNGALAQWTLSPEWGTNGSVFANTLAVKFTPNCVSAASTASSSTGTVSATLSSSSCSSSTIQYTIVDSTVAEMYVGPITCGNTSADAQFLPAAFVGFVNGVSTAAICTPTFQVLNVRAGIDLSTGSVVSSNSSGTLASASNPLLNAPLNGKAFNGVAANSSVTLNTGMSNRLATTTSNLGFAVLHELNDDAADSALSNDTAFLAAVEDVYTTYLNVLASSVLFESNFSNATAQLFVPENRLVITTLSTHILCGVFSVLAFAGAYLMWAHARQRRHSAFVLPSAPGLAGVCSIAGELTQLLDKEDKAAMDQAHLEAVLKDHRYGIDHEKRSIVIYEGGPQAVDVRRRLSQAIPPRDYSVRV